MPGKSQIARFRWPPRPRFILTAPAVAQQLEEVVVTAQYREQNIQDVPIAVTALGTQQIEAAGIFDATTIALNVPGMAYAEFSRPGDHLDAWYYVGRRRCRPRQFRRAVPGRRLHRPPGRHSVRHVRPRADRSIEGAAGHALRKRNAVGGAISVITSKPQNEFGGKAQVTVGNEGILRYQGLLTGGFTDSLSGKIVVNHRSHDGFTRNTLLNQDVQDEDYLSVPRPAAVGNRRDGMACVSGRLG